jgi:hypothetical protein
MAERFSFGVIALSFIIGLAVLHSAYWTPCFDSDFNLVFRYGHYRVEAKNELNTFRGSYTRDMVTRSPITVKLCLTREDLDRIYVKMVEIDFFSYPDIFRVPLSGDVKGKRSHWYTYYFKVQNGTKVKTVRWDDRYFISGSEEHENLMELARLIWEIIETKPEYRRMPRPRAGYV